MDRKDSDNDLIGRWRAGDLAAFESLVCRWQGPVARFLTHYTGDAGLVEDLCQEVFLRVFQARDRYRAVGAFSTWLYSVARNVARDAARRRRRPAAAGDGREPAAAGASAAQECERREAADLVRQALAGLPEPLRVVVVLRHYERLGFAEMGRLLGVPESTLKSRFAEAVRRLRLALAGRGYSPGEGTS